MKTITKRILTISLIALSAGSAVGNVAVSKYLAALHRAKEVVLQQDLWAMRRAIDFYRSDKKKEPFSPQELVEAGYLREIPIDL